MLATGQIKINKKKGFTLVEMLIVIVIIGILAAALIPRLTSARGRANDTARKADLQQLATALVTYQIDYGKFPADGVEPTVEQISDNLISVGMSTIPTDPSADREFLAVAPGTTDVCGDYTPGTYQYRTVSKHSISRAGFVLVAGTETMGGSNWLYDNTTSNCIDQDTELSSIAVCENINEDEASPCLFDSANDGDALRYIYTY